MKEILKRLEGLEKKMLPDLEVGSYERFLILWPTMDPLSRSLYVTMAECPELFGEMSPTEKQIAEYIRKMGLVRKTVTLSDILEGLESSGKM